MAWQINKTGKLEPVKEAMHYYFHGICGKGSTLPPAERVLCVAVWKQVMTILAAQPSGSIVDVRASGDMAAVGKASAPQHTVFFSVTPVIGFLE